MKNLILGMMLVIGSLSFASQDDRDVNGYDFNNLKLNFEVDYNVAEHLSNERLLFGMITNHRN